MRMDIRLKGGNSNPRYLFEKNLPLINELITIVCRRHRLDQDAKEEFSSSAMIKLMDKDYAVFRKYRGEAGPRAYLFTVINAHLLNFRDKLWGKWRPSAEACRLGPHGMLLEQLTARDGHSFQEAVEIIRTNHGLELSEKQLSAMNDRLPNRKPSHKIAGEEHLEQLSNSENEAEQNLSVRDNLPFSKKIGKVLMEELRSLSIEDRIILRMHFHDDVKVATIARVLGKNQKKLYRHIEKLVTRLQNRLTEEGIMKQEVLALLDDSAFLIRIDLNIKDPDHDGPIPEANLL